MVLMFVLLFAVANAVAAAPLKTIKLVAQAQVRPATFFPNRAARKPVPRHAVPFGHSELVSDKEHVKLSPYQTQVLTRIRMSQTPLIRALSSRRQDLASQILEAGADPKQTDDYGFSPLGWAASRNLTQAMIEISSRLDCPLGFKDRLVDGELKVEDVDFMIRNGVDIYSDILLAAFDKGNPEIVSLLTRYSEFADRIKFATTDQDFKAIKIFIEQGLYINFSSEDLTPVMLATIYRRLNILQYLLKNGASPIVSDIYGQNLLHWAVNLNDRDIVVALRHLPVSPHAQDINGITPLMNAEMDENEAIIKLLSEK